MSMISMTRRWLTLGACLLTVLAMLSFLGCGKKAEQQAETTTTEEAPATEPAASPLAGTYAAAVQTGPATSMVTLTLNADNTAMMSMDMMNNQPAMVQNGTWAMGAAANSVDVSFSQQTGDTPSTVVINFTASGDSLSLSNAEAAGFVNGMVLVKQAVQEEGHEGHSH